MKLEEISTGGERNVYLQDRVTDFADAADISTVRGVLPNEAKYIIKRKTHDDEIYYGVFSDSTIVSYLKLAKYNDIMYQVRLSQVEYAYRGHGYGSLLYDYAVMNDKLTILSDINLSLLSRDAWDKFRLYDKFKTVPYNIKTDLPEPDRVADVYTEEGRDELVWMAIPGNETINETLAHRNKDREEQGKWVVSWYGPDTYGEY